MSYGAFGLFMCARQMLKLGVAGALCEGVVWLLDHQLPSGAGKAEIWSEGAPRLGPGSTPDPTDFYAQVQELRSL